MSTTTAFSRKEVDKIEGHRSIVAIKNLLERSAGEGNKFVDCATFFYRLDSSSFLRCSKRAWNKKKSTWNYEWKSEASRRREKTWDNNTLTCSRMMANRLRWRLQKNKLLNSTLELTFSHLFSLLGVPPGPVAYSASKNESFTCLITHKLCDRKAQGEEKN